MPNPVTFQIEDYFNEFADQSAMAEAARFKTIPTGSYQLQATKYEGRYFSLNPKGYWGPVFDESGAVDPNWRKGVRLSAVVNNNEGKKISTINIEASWEAKRDAQSGEYDKLFRRWEQLTRAVYPNLKPEERGAKGTGEVLTMLTQYPIKAYITESFQVPAIDGSTKWVSAKSDEETRQFREAGYKSANFIQSISKV